MGCEINDYYSGISVSNEQAMECMMLCAETQSTCMLWGPPGVGKTTMLYDLSKKLGMPCLVINPSQDDVIDFKLPYLDQGKWKTEDGGSMAISRFAYSERLPLDKPGIIFVDEINTANQSMQATLYSLILEGRIGSYRVPKGTLRFAAGNREHDNCAAQPMSVALKDRLSLHLNVVAHKNSFVSYAIDHDFAPEIIAFVRETPQVLEGLDSQDPTGGCTPRSLEYLSDKIKRGLPRNLEHVIISGTIGKGCGAMFKGFLELYRSNVKIQDILDDPEHATIPEKMDILHCVCTALGHIADKSNIDTILKYVTRKEMQPTYAIIVVGDAIKRDPSIQALKPVRDFQLKHVNIIAAGL